MNGGLRCADGIWLLRIGIGGISRCEVAKICGCQLDAKTLRELHQVLTSPAMSNQRSALFRLLLVEPCRGGSARRSGKRRKRRGRCLSGNVRLCMETRELKNSHFIPAAFYKTARKSDPNQENPVVITKNVAVQTSKQAVAPLLCGQCEDRFNKYAREMDARELLAS